MKRLLTAIIIMLCVSSCTTYKIAAVQDYVKDKNGKLHKVGTPHIVPSNIDTIHAFIWVKGNQIYPYK